jgi:hypothetical protein
VAAVSNLPTFACRCGCRANITVLGWVGDGVELVVTAAGRSHAITLKPEDAFELGCTVFDALQHHRNYVDAQLNPIPDTKPAEIADTLAAVSEGRGLLNLLRAWDAGQP